MRRHFLDSVSKFLYNKHIIYHSWYSLLDWICNDGSIFEAKVSMYKLSFDFPYGVTYLKSVYLDDRISCTIEIPEFTSDINKAKKFENKMDAENAGRFFGGKYGYKVIEN